jgi:uncharacterized protein with HEPN domain
MDMMESIERIHSHAEGMDFEAFRAGVKNIDAVERNLQKISEAAIRLGPQAETLCPGLPWANIRGVGNWLRHQYDRLDVQTVWDTLKDDLPLLAQAVTSALEHLHGRPNRQV